MSEIINLEQVKAEFTSKVNKAQLASIKDLTFKIPKEQELEISILERWFSLVAEFKFLDSIPPNIEEIFIHSPTHIIYKVPGKKITTDSDITTSDLQLALEYLCLKNNISWNLQTPFVSFHARLFNRDVRVSLSHYCISSLNTSSCFIRFHSQQTHSLNNFGVKDSDGIKQLIKDKKNILIAGSTGSGKTSFLNSVLQLTPSSEHIIILEDTVEISKPHENCTQLLAENDKEKSLNQYMKNAMRMSPERLIIGEIRSKEVEPYLLAMNTGHKGLISTIHANCAKDALSRIALLFKIYSTQNLSYELILKLICTNIDTVVFLQDKKVEQIINVFGSEAENIFFEQIL